MNETLVSPRVADAYALVLSVVAYALGFVGFSWLFFAVAPGSSAVLAVLSVVAPALASLAGVWFCAQVLKDSGGSFSEAVSWKRANRSALLFGVVCGALVWVVYRVAVFLLVLTGVELSNSASVEVLLSSGAMWLLAPLMVLVVPFVEELFFRGLLLGLSVRVGMFFVGLRWARLCGAIMVSFVFAMMHVQFSVVSVMDWVAVLTTFVAGLACSWLTFRFNSLFPAVMTHVVYNGLTMVAVLFL